MELSALSKVEMARRRAGIIINYYYYTLSLFIISKVEMAGRRAGRGERCLALPARHSDVTDFIAEQ